MSVHVHMGPRGREGLHSDWSWEVWGGAQLGTSTPLELEVQARQLQKAMGEIKDVQTAM